MRLSPKALAAAALLTACSSAGFAQTIFTYGKKAVSKEEFLKAYNKNNTAEKPDERSYRDYLDLYIRFKLKVQAAYDLKLDTLPAQLAELTGFKNQVSENYMNDDRIVNEYIKEAAIRAQKDILVAHILVSVDEFAPADESKLAEERISNIKQQLEQGQDFQQVAARFSEDPSAKENKGLIGYITALVLPYEMETAIYNTPVGKTSGIVRSKIGFHIFKNLGERPAIGKVSIAQILIDLPPEATAQQTAAGKKLADSLYTALQKGSDFKQLAHQFSADNTSYQMGGEIMEFGVGRYTPAFEQAAFALTADGEICRPFETEYGFHIIKRLKRTPINKDINNKEWLESFRTQVLQSDRMEQAKSKLLQLIKKDIGFKETAGWNREGVLFMADSIFQRVNYAGKFVVPDNTALFAVGNKQMKVSDWKDFLRSMSGLNNMRRLPAEQLYEAFIERTAFDYYRANMEKYNPAYAYQVDEFRDGNLLFEIMQKKVWDLASTDSVGLQRYYESNRNKYWWEASAEAVIFTAVSEEAAEQARRNMEKDPSGWKNITDNSNGNVQADSGRFELSQIPVFERTNFTDGLITANIKNETDHSVSFAYIIKVYKDRSPRSFADARGFVVNDYQTTLENKWIGELKKKYPVKIKESVVKSLPK